MINDFKPKKYCTACGAECPTKTIVESNGRVVQAYTQDELCSCGGVYKLMFVDTFRKENEIERY